MDSHSPVTHSQTANHHYAYNGKLMLILSLVALFSISIFVALFHTYTGWCRHRHRHRRNSWFHRGPRPNSSVFNSGPATTTTSITTTTITTPRKEGLERSVLDSIPTFSYEAASHDPPLECAVCLSEFVVMELGRVLPGCNHCFHIGCIDTWFSSRSNCPLCRAPVKPAENPVGNVTLVGETSGSVDVVDCGLSSSSLLRKPPELVGIITGT